MSGPNADLRDEAQCSHCGVKFTPKRGGSAFVLQSVGLPLGTNGEPQAASGDNGTGRNGIPNLMVGVYPSQKILEIATK